MAASDSQPHTTSTTAAPRLDWLDVAKQDVTRKKFLESIESELLQGISPRVWAFAMVVPVDKLAQLIDSLGGPTAPLFRNLDANIKSALDVWKQHGTREEPADEDNNQSAKRRKTASRSTSAAVSEATSEAASEATEQVTEQPSDGRVKKLATQVYHDITDFYLLRKLI
jgi:hypothetical protein